VSMPVPKRLPLRDPWPSLWQVLPIFLAGVAVLGCEGRTGTRQPAPATPAPKEAPASPAAAPAAGEPGPFRFTDILTGSGVDFVHTSGMTSEKLFPTANGSGLALFDYDGDGRLDLYFATGNALPLAAVPAASNRLYRNLGGGKFRDETERSGLGF